MKGDWGDRAWGVSTTTRVCFFGSLSRPSSGGGREAAGASTPQETRGLTAHGSPETSHSGPRAV